RHIGPLPKLGEWVRLEVDAKQLGFSNGAQINGMAFTQFDGTVYWDRAGIVSRGQIPTHFATQGDWEGRTRAAPDPKLPRPGAYAVKVEAGKRTAEQQKLVRHHFARFACTTTRGVFDPLNAEEERLKKAEADFEASLPSTMVMQEMERPRDTFV